jgi:tRNA(Arg) A34 adenosine deaminase TadA
MSESQIRTLGLQELEKVSNTSKWKTWLADYQFVRPDDSFIWLTNILALKGVDDTNFGIGCILIDGNGNIVAYGNNEVFIPYFRSDRHAEMVVMNKFEDTHPYIHNKEVYTLYTSLEPCPMCLVRLITSDINKVLYAAQDSRAGMVSRMAEMPSLWIELSKEKVFSQADCSQGLINAANNIFLLNSDELLEKIKNRKNSQ